MKPFSLIVPIAADKPLFEKEMPFDFSLAPDGIMYCIKAILGLNLDKFTNMYFTILKKHDDLYCLSDLFALQFKRLKLVNAKVVVLSESTASQPETIYRTIEQEGINGAFFIKDADCSFTSEVEPINSVAIYPLEKLEWVNPQHKSYVAVDDMFYVTNIIEKKIVSHYFSAGGYSFESALLFCKYIERYENTQGLYISHIIYSMLLDKTIFRPYLVSKYNDYGTYERKV